jgi:hypothetical protein
MNYSPESRLPSAGIVFTSDGRVIDGAQLSGPDAAQRIEAETKFLAYKEACRKRIRVEWEARRRAEGLCICGRVHDRPELRTCSVCAAERRATKVESQARRRESENQARLRALRLEVLREVEHEWICTKTSGTFTEWLRDQIRTGESA